MQSRRLTITVTIIAAALTLSMSACSKDSDTSTSQHKGVSLFGTDGIMSNGFGDTVKVPGILNGLAGTAALNPTDPAFNRKVLQINPGLDDFSYAGQAYDAVMITALATDVAGKTDGKSIAKYINGVTELGKSGVECTTYAQCQSDVKKGKDIAYRGITVTSGFTKAGEPSTASYGTLHFGSNNLLDPQKTEFVNAGDEATASPSAPAGPAPTSTYNGPPLNLGLLLPETGGLAEQGKPIIAAAKAAVQEINRSGGVLGKPITTELVDDATDTAKAVAGAKKLIGEGATAIIGPSFSGGAAAVIPVAVAANVVEFSPSATSGDLSTANDHGMFFRTAPSDLLQSQAIADIITRTGAQKVFIVVRSDSYGTPFAKDVTSALVQDGVAAADITTAGYSADANANNTNAYARIASSITAFHANAVLLIGYEEIGGMIKAMSADKLAFNAS